MKNRIKLGRYDLGMRAVDLYVSTEMNGGYFNTVPSGGVSEITVGIRGSRPTWSQALAILIHEATEFSYVELGLRFSPTPDYANDAAAYLFTMDHTKFGEATARVAYFLAECLPDFSNAYKKHGPK